MEPTDNSKNSQRAGCFAVKYDNCVWAAFKRDLLVNYLDDIPNVESAVKFFEADPVFDDSNPLVDPNDRRTLSAGNANLRYIVCDRSALEFQLSCASRSQEPAVVSSQICKIVVDQEEAKSLLAALRADSTATSAENEWYRSNGERSDLLFEEAYKATGTKVGKC